MITYTGISIIFGYTLALILVFPAIIVLFIDDNLPSQSFYSYSFQSSLGDIFSYFALTSLVYAILPRLILFPLAILINLALTCAFIVSKSILYEPPDALSEFLLVWLSLVSLVPYGPLLHYMYAQWEICFHDYSDEEDEYEPEKSIYHFMFARPPSHLSTCSELDPLEDVLLSDEYRTQEEHNKPHSHHTPHRTPSLTNTRSHDNNGNNLSWWRVPTYKKKNARRNNDKEYSQLTSVVDMDDGAGASQSQSLPLLQESQDKQDIADIEKKESMPHATAGRLAQWAKVEWRMLLSGTVALVVSSAATLAQPYYFGKIIGVCSDPNADNASLNKYALLLLCIFLVGGVATFIRGYQFTLVGERIVRNIRKELFAAIIVQDIAFFDANNTGELMNRLASDTAMIQNALSVNVSMGLSAMGQIFVSLVLLFVTSWRLTFVMLAVVPALVILVVLYGNFTKKLTKQYQDALAKAAEVGSETISNIRIVRSFGGETAEARKYSFSVQQSYEKGAAKALAYGLFVGVIIFLFNAAILLVIYYGANQVLNGQLDVGSLISFIFYTIYVAGGLASVSNLYTEFMNAMGASERIFVILDTKPTIPVKGGLVPAQVPKTPRSSKDAVTIVSPILSVKVENGHKRTSLSKSQLSPENMGSIEFRDVFFRYPMRPEAQVLRGFNLAVQPKQTVALVGPSGSGKSTILALLERFYDVESGSITIDGVPLRDLDPRWLHKHIAIVPQEPVLFSGTIKSNILYSRSTMDSETAAALGNLTPQNHDSTDNDDPLASLTKSEIDNEVEWAGKEANAHSFIMGFPDGYDTVVGERGVRLSGGQKQRVAIARALLARPRILLLDEATSALDSESEQLVQEAIDRLMKTRTVIVIAHRLSTVRDADLIAVVSDGRVADLGSHDDLMQSSAIYQNLVRRQLQWGAGSGPTLLDNVNTLTNLSNDLPNIVLNDLASHSVDSSEVESKRELTWTER